MYLIGAKTRFSCPVNLTTIDGDHKVISMGKCVEHVNIVKCM